MRVSLISYFIIIMGTCMVLDRRSMFSWNNILYEKAETETGQKNKDQKSQETALQEAQIKAEALYVPLLRQLRSPDVSIIYW